MTTQEILDAPIKTCKVVKTTNYNTFTYEDLYKYVKSYYSLQNKSGTTMFEVYSGDEWVKPHIDYEEYMEKKRFSAELVLEKLDVLKTTLCELFQTTPDKWAISKDNRLITKKGVEKYKISFHFILIDKKVQTANLKAFLEENIQILESRYLVGRENDGSPWGIDFAIYRSGMNKFRMPYTKKSADDEFSLCIPMNYKDKEDYHCHLITHLVLCEEIELEIKYEKTSTEQANSQLFSQNKANNQAEIDDIISKHTVISQSEVGHMILYDIEKKYCGREHSNNHNYLVYDPYTSELYVKCHNKEKCGNFRQVLFKARLPTKNFDIDYLNNIPIPADESNNYIQVRNYFEQFVLLMRDSNSYYRVDFTFDQKYKIMNRKIVPIDINGYKEVLYYKEVSEDNQVKNKMFIEQYKKDHKSKSYFNFQFIPHGKKGSQDQYTGISNYNLFQGFNYEYTLTHDEKQYIPKEKLDDFELLKDHILKNVCSGDINQYKYLLEFFANIIQYPALIPQIILIFYSKTHGTGKSNLTKFLSSVIGQDLSYFGSFNQITEKHTNAHVGTLINVVEEVDKITTRTKNAVIKDYSQRESAVYNEKNKSQIRLKTYVRYIFTTNNHDGVYFDAEDRRYVLITFNKVRDMDYINRIQDIMEDKYTIYLFGKYLEEWYIQYMKPNQWIDRRPLSEDYWTMMTKDTVDLFFQDFTKLESIEIDQTLDNTEYFLDPKDENLLWIKKDCLYKNLYKTYSQENQNGISKGKNKFYQTIKGNYSDEVSIKKKKGKDYFVIDLDEMWQRFYKNEKFINRHKEALEG